MGNFHQYVSIHPHAKIGKNVQIENFVTIAEDVEIGEGTWIGPNVTIMNGARIGKNCKIFPGAVISAIPQDLKYKNEETRAIIGDYTTIREYVTVNKGTLANMETKVGSYCLLMAYVHVAHDCIVGDHCILANGVTLAGHVTVEDFVNVGGLVAIQQFIKVGAHSMIAGGSLVRKDIPPFVKCAREPLSYVGINAIGLRRRGFLEDKINHIQDYYRYIYLKGLNVSNALHQLEIQTQDSKEREHILDFIRTSKIGILKAGNQEDESLLN